MAYKHSICHIHCTLNYHAMKRITTLALAALFAAAPGPVAAQSTAHNDSELLFRKYRVTVFPGLSTNGVNATDYTARYSLNIIAGYHGGLEGTEIGLININKHYARGIQFGLLNATGGDMSGINFAGFMNISGRAMEGIQASGIMNISGEEMEGLQASGIMNISGDEMSGLQGSGVLNISRGNLSGLQIAGSANISGGNLEGLQLSGALNMARGNLEGLQGTGGVNIAQTGEGLQLAGIANISRTFEGLQISGFLNYADRVEGVQIGVLNLAREFEGAPIGLISLYGNGRKNLDFWVNESGFVNAGFKTGTHEVYNMISVGYNMGITDRDVISLGWTVGRHRTLSDAWNRAGLDDYFVNADLSFTKILEGDNLEQAEDRNNLFTWRYMVGRTVGDQFSVYLGPSLNLLVSSEPRNADYTPYSIFERSTSDYDVRGWIGFTMGMQLF